MIYHLTSSAKLTPKVVQKIKRTALEDGGITVQRFGKPLHRYIYGIGIGFQLPVNRLSEQAVRALHMLANAVSGSHYGIWIDGNTAYFDIVESTNDSAFALWEARHHNEKAIYDRIEDRSIPTEEFHESL